MMRPRESICFIFLLLLSGCCLGFSSPTVEQKSVSLETLTATSTKDVIVIDCNGTRYEPSQGVVHFNSSGNITNCLFENSNVHFYSSSSSSSVSTPSLVLNVQNCSFVKSVLLVKGDDISLVQVDSTTFTSNSSFLIRSKTVRVAITNSLFVDNYNNADFQKFFDPNYAVLGIVDSVEVLIQRCNFTDNIDSVAIKLLNGLQSVISDCNFENNWYSIFTITVETTISRCNFSKHNTTGSLITANDQSYVLLIENSHFFDNIYYDYGAVASYGELIVTRSVFRNNTIIATPNTYTLSGAAISSFVSPFCLQKQ